MNVNMKNAERQKLIKSKKFAFRLMTTGIKRKARIFGMGIIEVSWHVPFFSEPRVIWAANEDLARYGVRDMLKKRWTGFVLFEAKEAKA